MIHTGSRSESFSSWSMSRTMWRSAESRPVFRVLQRAWRIYSTDSFEFDLINSGKWPHKLRSILSSVSSSTKQPNSLFKFFTTIQSSNLVGTRSRSEKQRVRESSLCFHFQTSVPVPPTAPLWFLPLKSLDWLESDLKGSVVLFLGWVVGGLDFELGFNWAQDDSLNLLGLGWAGLG